MNQYESVISRVNLSEMFEGLDQVRLTDILCVIGRDCCASDDVSVCQSAFESMKSRESDPDHQVWIEIVVLALRGAMASHEHLRPHVVSAIVATAYRGVAP